MTTPEWNEGGYGGRGGPYRPPGAADPEQAAEGYAVPQWDGYAAPPQSGTSRQAAAGSQPYAQPLPPEQPSPAAFPDPQADPSYGPGTGHAAARYQPGPGYSGAQYQPGPGYPAAAHPAVAHPAVAHPAVAHPAVAHPAAAPDRPGPQDAEGRGAAQESPARTGSPIVPPGAQPALLTAVLAVLTAAAAGLGRPALAVPAILLQALTAAGWFRLNGMWPARQGIALAFLAGLVLDAGLFAAGGQHAPAVAAGALGVWLPLVLVQQLRHRGSADERLASLTATAAATVLTVLAGGYLAAAGMAAGSAAVVVGAVAVAAAVLLRAVPLPSAVSVVLSLLAAAGSGALGGPAAGLATGPAVLLALAAGVCALIGLRVASYDFPSRFVHFTAGVALPLTIAAPVVSILGQVLR